MNATAKRILIVDDDVDNRTNIKDILDEVGYRTDIAEDGPSAIQLVQQNRYDVALLDFRMPGMDGAELYSEIKKLRPKLVAIMITAYAADWKIAQSSIDSVCHKPINVAELLAWLENAPPGN